MTEIDGSESLDLLTGDDRIVAEAKKRFRRCEDYEATARRRFKEDHQFCNADADNQYQWPNKIATERQVAARPTLTINKVRQHCLQITNDAKQNKPSVTVHPTSGGATYEAAQVFEGVIRHIEYVSNAEAAYDTATTFQVQCGIGYWRVVTDYANDDTFDQEIFIKRVKDPLSIYLDPDIQEMDGSDARFGFVFEDMPKDLFKLEYPDYDGIGMNRTAIGNNDGWMDEHHIRVAEYYRVSQKRDRLIAMLDPQTNEQTVLRESEIPAKLRPEILADEATKKRDILTPEIEWFKIAGDEIIDRKVGDDAYQGKYIPLVRVIGEETIIDGQLDRKGHTRAMIDPQRMVNYWSSAATEFVALQGKAPFVGAAEAIEGYETYWQTANTVNYSILPYNAKDEKGQLIPPPQRSEPPTMAAAYVTGLQMAYDQLQMVSGQYAAKMGEQSNERSGKAIQERQRQGDNATYHYIDNLATAIRFTGKILIDLIPKIYDTPRVIRIMGEDGNENEVNLDPQARTAFVKTQAQQGQAVKSIFNPTVGQYDIQSDVGPGYATKRQEAWNAFVQIVTQAPNLMPVVGDLMFKNADFPGSDEIAKRLKNMVPPQALGEGVPPALQEAQGQIQKLMQQIAALVQKSAEDQIKIKSHEGSLQAKDEQKAIDWEKMITDRIKVLLPTMVTPAQIAEMHHDLAVQEHAAQGDILQSAHEAILSDMSAENQQQPQPQSQAA